MLSPREMLAREIAECNAHNERTQRERGLPYTPMPVPEEEVTVFTLADIVRRVVHDYRLPADAVWRHTLPDLLLMLVPPEQSGEGDKDFRHLEAAKLVEKLSPADRMELEGLISDHC